MIGFHDDVREKIIKLWLQPHIYQIQLLKWRSYRGTKIERVMDLFSLVRTYINNSKYNKQDFKIQKEV